MTLLTPVLFAVLLAPAAADKPEDLIVGKWSHTEKQDKIEVTVSMEFTKDGKITVEMTMPQSKESIKLAGTYKVIDAKTLEVTMKDPTGQEKTEKGGYEVTKEKLTLIDKEGKKTDFTPVKEKPKEKQ